jgi:quercetin dioxygenase-like cupin family protein
MKIALIIATILLLPILYNLLFPLKPPMLENYFQPGQTFISNMEGVKQTIIKQVGDKVYSELTLSPGAVGPPEHLHIGFDESATVTKGTLSVNINNQVFEVSEGSRIYFPKGEYHTFSNNTDSEVVVTCDHDNDYLPVTFAYTLAQFYPLLDGDSKLKMVHMFFKMSMFGDLFDSYVAEVPVNGQKAIKAVLQPYARVLGYKLYDEKSRP